MATAKVENVKKIVTTEVDEEMVQLTLTREEAQILRGLCAYVGGSEIGTYRQYMIAVRKAFEAAGIGSWGPDYFSGSVFAKSLPVTNPYTIALSF